MVDNPSTMASQLPSPPKLASRSTSSATTVSMNITASRSNTLTPLQDSDFVVGDITGSGGRTATAASGGETASLKDNGSIITNDYEGDDEGSIRATTSELLLNGGKLAASSTSSSSIISTVKSSIQPMQFKGPPRIRQDTDNADDDDGPVAKLSSPSRFNSKKSEPSMPVTNQHNAPAQLDMPKKHPTSSFSRTPKSADAIHSFIDADSKTHDSAQRSRALSTQTGTSRRRTSIQPLSALQPALSIDIPFGSLHESPTSPILHNLGPDHEAPALTEEEYQLLLKLEHQNKIITSDPKATSDVEDTMRTLLLINQNQNSKKSSLSPTLDSSMEPSAPMTSQNSLVDEDADWDFWGKVLTDFDGVVKKQNKLLVRKIQAGLPKAVRGTVWHSFARSHPQSFLLHKYGDEESQSAASSPTRERFRPPDAFVGVPLDDAYVELLKLPSNYEKMIIRDLARTFPKHEFFKNSNGLGQESLFNVMKAYSLYDVEVGYCQGLSFIVGTLLLNMPDEQAFACLVHLMHTYQLRGLFTPRMELLQMRLFQFDRLLEEILPRVHEHLDQEGIRSTMYASQWFLTLFSYRFPLDLVYRLLDIIFASGVVYGATGSEGGMMDAVMERVSESVAVATGTHQPKSNESGLEAAIVIFRFAFALLKKNEEMILALDFEPLLEFLKHGLFELYLGADAGPPSPETQRSTSPSKVSGVTSMNTAAVMSSRNRAVPRRAIDDLVRDAMSNQFRGINKKRLTVFRKEYEEELKKNDPNYLHEKSLEAKNQRLTNDLKRSEKMLADLNKDHCDLAGQMVSLRIELQKEKDVSSALQRQVHDLKTILNLELPKLNRDELDAILAHEVTMDNAQEPLPGMSAGHVSPSTSQDRLPSLTEQITILQTQNMKILEEVNHWQTRAEAFERQLREFGVSSRPGSKK